MLLEKWTTVCTHVLAHVRESYYRTVILWSIRYWEEVKTVCIQSLVHQEAWLLETRSLVQAISIGVPILTVGDTVSYVCQARVCVPTYQALHSLPLHSSDWPLTHSVILSPPAALSSLLFLEHTQQAPHSRLWRLLCLWSPPQMPLNLLCVRLG